MPPTASPRTINVGTQVPVLDRLDDDPSAGGIAVSQKHLLAKYGRHVQVNARVNPSGVVTLIINQEISSVSRGFCISASLGTPAFDQQIVQTQITVQDGDTIAIGGPLQDTDHRVAPMVFPGSIRIPWLGALFGSKTTRPRSQ